MLEMPYVTTGKFNRHGFQWCIKEHAILKDIYCKKKKKKKKREREREREKEKRERLLVFLVLFCCSRFYFGGLQRSVYLD